MSNRQFRPEGIAEFVAGLEQTVATLSDLGARKKKIRKLGNCSGQFATRIYRNSHDFNRFRVDLIIRAGISPI